ncbi:MAG: Uma2 family endonuclease [Chloroflexi bacterium]|uniref:Uma2 family endonuclease n=1 Tax=Candidatus Chlorohelix allophototropha TaxID=3003348 RepID=A0A8T7M2N9_9CHLR|nr:Uma2 family endonuclease [Chloroflexota bacterium]WJW66639.1 Uma2 family endonuclease [Chloroflexota bacterium L227-S17]
MFQPNKPFYPVEEYLWKEQRANIKNEYFDGQIYSMAGGSPEHSQIQANIILELGTLLRGKDCRVLTSDLKIGVEDKAELKARSGRKKSRDFITYPDASVICGQLQFYRGDRFTVANPLILFEVLSPSTRNYDTSFKLEHYQRITSLKAYIMLDSERIWVQSCQRIGDENRWILEEPLEDLEDVLRLEALGLEIPLSQLYERVEFEE